MKTTRVFEVDGTQLLQRLKEGGYRGDYYDRKRTIIEAQVAELRAAAAHDLREQAAASPEPQRTSSLGHAKPGRTRHATRRQAVHQAGYGLEVVAGGATRRG